jgi:transposase-like protein
MASAIEAIPAMPAAMEPGAVASEVARAAGIYPSQLFRWRQQLCAVAPAAVEFSRVAVVPGPGAKVAVVRSLLQQAFGLLPPISTGSQREEAAATRFNNGRSNVGKRLAQLSYAVILCTKVPY